MARYQPLSVQANTYLKTEIKDFLPVIGNVMPNILLSQFDDTETWNYTATAGLSTGAIDYYNTIRGKGCYKITQTATSAQNSVVTLSRSFTVPINVINFGSETNNQSEIVRTGKYGADIDKFFATLNLKLTQRTSTTASTIVCNLYSGTKYASASLPYHLLNLNYWHKKNIAKLDGGFTYNNGFALDDYENITKIEFVLTLNAATTNSSTIYFQDFWSALPTYDIDNALAGTTAYYQGYNQPNNSYYVSEIFGDDTNSGLTRALPVRTMDKVMELMASVAKAYVIIMDSETYKPVDIVSNQAGWSSNYPSSGIWADYLETPMISAPAGNSSIIRQGSRVYYRSRYFKTGTPYYVGSSIPGASDANAGTNPALPKLTLGSAITAMGTNDYVEILDSSIYMESVNVSKNVRVQAAPKQTPTWINNAQPYCFGNGGSAVVSIFYGINFKGSSVVNETIILTGTSEQILVSVEDCTFSNIGLNTSSAAARAMNLTQPVSLNIINNIFIDNAAKTGITDIIFYTHTVNPASLHNFIIKNNNVTLSDTAAVFFRYPGNYFNGQNLVRIESNVFNNNVSTNALGSAEAKIINYTGTAALGAGTPGTSFYFIYNLIQGKIQFRVTNLAKLIIYAYSNNFYGAVTTAFFDFNSPATTPGAGSIIELSNNKFYGLYRTGSGIYMNFIGTNTAVTFHNNIYTKLLNGLYYAISASTFTSLNNIYYDNTNGATIDGNGVTSTSSGIIFEKNAVGILHTGAGTTTISSGYFYLNTADTSGSVTITTKYTVDPKLLDPEKNNFSLAVDSPLLSQWYFGITAIRVISFLSYCQWVNIVGDIGYSLYPAANHVNELRFCFISNFEVASSTEPLFGVNMYNCYLYKNSIGYIGNNGSSLMTSTLRYNIFDKNNSGMFLGIGNYQYNTIINSTQFGVYDGTDALVSIQQFLKTFKNNIVEGSGIFDWNSNVMTDYCCIGSRTSISKAVNPFVTGAAITVDVNLLTAGLHDINANALLNNTYKMIALKSMGYFDNDPCYLADSTGTFNIGARYVNHIKSVLKYNIYNFASAQGGTVNVWAYENPQHYQENVQPMNLNSVRTLNGDYFANPTGYAKEITMTWGTPGEEGKINADLKSFIELMYKTYWIIGVSYDNAHSYIYYKLKKENTINMEQKKYLHDTIPYGNTTMVLIEIPEFLLTDFTITTGNMI